jgi:acetate kinase
VAVFDTAYHQTIPREAFLYALPYRLYESAAVRRYGFHGTSHRFVARQAADVLGRPLNGLNLITIHLGNGASMTAVKDGRSADTTMGMTPLEGLVMGTRCGDLDPAVPTYLMRHLGMSVDAVEDLLNRQSGLKGLCGTNDMREVLGKAREGNEAARSAVKMYTYRIRKYIGAFFAILERVDGLVFTGGIGEKSPEIRRGCCEGLTRLGIDIDPAANEETIQGLGRVEGPSSQVPVLVVPTNEELQIARETLQVVN